MTMAGGNLRQLLTLLTLLGLTGLFGTGCASSHKKIDWSKRIGTYHFDQAVKELGPPDKSATLSDGTVVAQWLDRRGSAWTRQQVLYGGWRVADDVAPGPDQFLTLTFSPDSLLTEWKVLFR